MRNRISSYWLQLIHSPLVVRSAIKLLKVVVFVLALSVFNARSASQTGPAQISLLSPAKLSVKGTAGDHARRTLLLLSPAPLTNAQIASVDIVSTDDKSIFPKENISAGSLPERIPENRSIPLDVKFNLNQAPSGQFDGFLLVRHDGGDATIPVSILVKDRPCLPLLLLITGLAAGIFVTKYRTEGQPRDEILVRKETLRGLLRGDPQLPQSFVTSIKAIFPQVDFALGNSQWEPARQAISKAEALWTKWLQDRNSWIDQFNYLADLKNRLASLKEPSSEYLRRVARNVGDVELSAPQSASPNAFRDSLDAIAKQMNCYLQLQRMLEDFERGLSNFSNLPDKLREYKAKGIALKRRFSNLLPDDPAYQQLQIDIQAALTDLNKAIPADATAFATNEETDLELIGSPPGVAKSPPIQDNSANYRLKVFLWVSYGLALLFLTGAGFIELYWDKATFGANGWRDYFGLLVWGFGAEATRASVAQLVRNWNLPGMK